MTDPSTLTKGVHHIGLAVSDLEPTQNFFERAVGFRKVGENTSYPAVFLSDGSLVLTLWQLENPDNAVSFDRKKNVGLHHLALKVADAEALETVFERVRVWPDVDVEFAPEPPGSGSSSRHFICAIPGGIRVEFFAPAPA